MLSEDIKTEIQQSYSRFLSAQGWRARYGQKLMIAAIANAIGSIDTDSDAKRITDGPHVAVIEAGTGVGKTVAYLTALIPIAKEMKKKIVVSTATVALQDQLVRRDIPTLLKQAQISSKFILAKGRGRYVCNANLQQWATSSPDSQLSMLAYFEEANASASAEEVDMYTKMRDGLNNNEWDGDRDSWPDTVPDAAWFRLTSDHTRCSGKSCDYYDECVFHRAREYVFSVDIVVSNHDLVLADLAIGGGSILPAPEDTIYVFDEAHHLPAKALSHFSRQTRLNGSLQWLDELESLVNDAGKMLPLKPGHLASLSALIERLPAVREALRSMLQWCRRSMPINPKGNEAARLRFPMGYVDEAIMAQVQTLSDQYAHMVGDFAGLCAEVSGWFERDLDVRERGLADVWAPVVGMARKRLESDTQCWFDFGRLNEPDSKPWARWITELSVPKDHDFLVSCSPVQSDEHLQHHLWSRCFGAVLTSATLSVNNDFAQFYLQAGLSDGSIGTIVPSPFDYPNVAELHIPKMTSQATDASGHTAELVNRMPELLQNTILGHLVLFASRRQMNAVFEALPLDQTARIIRQGDYSKSEVLKRHCEKIDSGECSVIFGLASFAEGIDLPGPYCQQVVIAKLPFSVPDDPVIATLSEWLESKGHNPFIAVTVPDCALKLKQAVGRLIRSESDQGRIVILDDRIITKRYGTVLLNSLPAMKRVRRSWQMVCASA